MSHPLHSLPGFHDLTEHDRDVLEELAVELHRRHDELETNRAETFAVETKRRWLRGEALP